MSDPGCATFLLVPAGGGPGFELPTGRRILGSDAGCDVVLAGPEVAPRHVAFVNLYGQLWVTDLGSPAGTSVNGRRQPSVTLLPGDRVQVGGVELLVTVKAAPGQPPAPAGLPGVLIHPSTPQAPDAGVPQLPGHGARLWRQLEITARLGARLARGTDEAAVASEIVLAVQRSFAADRVFLLQRQPDGPAGAVAAAIICTSQPRPGRGPEPSRTIVRRALEERIALASVDAGQDPRFRSAGSVLDQGIRSVMCAPVWSNALPWGVLYVDSLVERAVFDQADLWLLEVLASQAGLALERARSDAAIRAQVEQQTREIRARAEELETLHRSRRVLASLAAHDLRHPLVSLRAGLRVLLRDGPAGLSAEERSGLARDADLMHDRTLDLADCLVLDDPQLPVEREWLALGPLVDQVVSRELARAREQGLRLDASVPEGLLAHVDARLFTRLVENLISNALGVVPEGGAVGVTAELSPVPAGESGDRDLSLTVTDSGPGIPAEDRERIFASSVRLGEGTGPHGRGLGLHFCLLAAVAHGGAIHAAGRPGQNQLVVSLPAAGRRDG